VSIISTITSPTTLVLAAVLASPTLYGTFRGEVELGDASMRFLLCIPVAAVMLGILRMLTSGYAPPEAPLRRASDVPAADGPRSDEAA
jgi:hypothetical protein